MWAGILRGVRIEGKTTVSEDFGEEYLSDVWLICGERNSKIKGGVFTILLSPGSDIIQKKEVFLCCQKKLEKN